MADTGTAIKEVLVFCGSAPGNNPVYMAAARRLGELLGKNQYNIVYGGGTGGLMGEVSQAALAQGSRVRGITVQVFHASAQYKKPEGSTEDITSNLMERKARMLSSGDAALILPGGFGTFDEIGEIVVAQDMKAWADPDAVVQPVIILNTNGFYDETIRQYEKAQREGFIYPGHEKIIQVAGTPEEAIGKLNEWRKMGRITARALDNAALPVVVVTKPPVLRAG